MKKIKFWAVICGKEITYYINRTQYPLGLRQKIWPAAHFVWEILSAAHLFEKKSGLRRILFIIFLLKPACIWIEVSCSVYEFIGGKNDSSSNTQRS